MILKKIISFIIRMINVQYLDFDNLPETNFTCAGKVIGGYYADLETSCQMFHVCTIGQLDEPMDIKFLCLNGTVFDQETRVCERVDEVDCTKSERFYYLNLELYGNTMVPFPEGIYLVLVIFNHDVILHFCTFCLCDNLVYEIKSYILRPFVSVHRATFDQHYRILLINHILLFV